MLVGHTHWRNLFPNLTQTIPRVVGLMQGETWVSYEKCAVCRGLCLEWIDDEKAGADSP